MEKGKVLRVKWTPNCARCKWAGEPLVTEVGTGTLFPCRAQANRWADDVYNNRKCRKLYEPADVKISSPQTKEG